METIKAYLDNMFLGLPGTDEIFKAKANLLEIMEDKYEELKRAGKSENEAIGTVIAEFGNIDELLNELGIDKSQNGAINDIEKRYLGDTEVQNVLSEKKRHAVLLSTGISICILALAIMSLLQGILLLIYGSNITEDALDCYCAITLLLFIVIGVGIIVYTGIKMDKYDYLEKCDLEISGYSRELLQNEKEAYRNKYAMKICVGVIVCVLALIPPIVAEMSGETAIGEGFSIFMMFTMVSFGVWHFVTAGVISDVYNLLLGQGDYSKKGRKSKSNSQLMEKIGSVYWPLVSIGYLVWSFLTMRWYFTWIVWPIAALLYAAISIIVTSIEGLVKEGSKK